MAKPAELWPQENRALLGLIWLAIAVSGIAANSVMILVAFIICYFESSHQMQLLGSEHSVDYLANGVFVQGFIAIASIMTQVLSGTIYDLKYATPTIAVLAWFLSPTSQPRQSP